MQALPVAQIKKALRKEQLRHLRTWAKAEPAQVAAASRRVCDHVYDYIMSRYRPAHAAPMRPVTAPHPAVPPTPLFVLAYLPLYFEVDLVPLMERLWQVAASQAIHVMTPVVLPENFGQQLPAAALSSSTHSTGLPAPVTAAPCPMPATAGGAATAAAAAAGAPHALQSAMAFVEVLDDEDLRRSFAPQGAYGIREFDSTALAAWLLGPAAAATCSSAPAVQAGSVWRSAGAAPCHETAAAAPAASAPASQEAVEGAATALSPCMHRRRRHVLLCDAYETLFPQAHAAGYRPDGLMEYGQQSAAEAAAHTREASPEMDETVTDTTDSITADAGDAHVCELSDVSVLVLAPGILFDVRTGGRLGKGGGFYDRFLAHHSREHRRRTPPSHAASHASTTTMQAHSVGAAQPPVPQWEVMAVAFDAQVLHIPRSAAATAAAAAVVGGVGAQAAPLGCISNAAPSTHAPSPPTSVSTAMPERIPVDAHDQRMHCVASPAAGVEQVWEFLE